MNFLKISVILIISAILITSCSTQDIVDTNPSTITPSLEPAAPTTVLIDDEQPENNIQDNDDLSTDFIEPEPSDILNDTIRIAKISDSTGDGRCTLVYAADFPYDL